MSSDKISQIFTNNCHKSKYGHYQDGDGEMNAKDLDMRGLCNRMLESDRYVVFLMIWADKLYRVTEVG